MGLAPQMDAFDRDTIDSLRSQGISNQLVNRVEIMRESAYITGRGEGLKAGAADAANLVDHLLTGLASHRTYSSDEIRRLVLDSMGTKR